MFENLIKSKLNIKKEANLLIVEYKKWSFKLPIYLIIFYILHTWLGYKMKEISIITLYLYNLPFLLIFEEKYKEIIGEILKYSETKDYLQKLINITNF